MKSWARVMYGWRLRGNLISPLRMVLRSVVAIRLTNGEQASKGVDDKDEREVGGSQAADAPVDGHWIISRKWGRTREALEGEDADTPPVGGERVAELVLDDFGGHVLGRTAHGPLLSRETITLVCQRRGGKAMGG